MLWNISVTSNYSSYRACVFTFKRSPCFWKLLVLHRCVMAVWRRKMHFKRCRGGGEIMDAHEMSSFRNGRRGRSGLSAKNVPYLIIFPSVPRAKWCSILTCVSIVLLLAILGQACLSKGKWGLQVLVLIKLSVCSESKENVVLLKIALETENVVCTSTVSSVFSDSMYLVFNVKVKLPEVAHVNGH